MTAIGCDCIKAAKAAENRGIPTPYRLVVPELCSFPDRVDGRGRPSCAAPATLSRVYADTKWELTEAEADAVDNLCLAVTLLGGS